MSREINPFGLRMQPDLRERLTEAAKENGRSLNAEIVHRLETSFGAAAFTTDGLTAEQAAALANFIMTIRQPPC